MLLALFAALVSPIATHAQVTYTGTAANQNFGSVAIGSTGTMQTFTFSITAGTTVGSIGILTVGAPNLDFANATGTTCAATSYASAATCQVNVTLHPLHPGVRSGALVFFSGTNNKGAVLGNVQFYGVGIGPQIGFAPGVATAVPFTGSNLPQFYPNSVAIDGANNLFITSGTLSSYLLEVPADGANSFFAYTSPLGAVTRLAIDGAGDLYLAAGEGIVEFPAGGGADFQLDLTVNGKAAYGRDFTFVGLDRAGNLYAIYGTPGQPPPFYLAKIPPGGGEVTLLSLTANGSPVTAVDSIAFDSANNMYLIDSNNNNRRIVEAPADGSAPFEIHPAVASGEPPTQPSQIASDAAGDLFVAYASPFEVVEVPAGGAPLIVLEPPIGNADVGLAVNGSGDLFIANPLVPASITKIVFSQPPALSFPAPAAASHTDSPQTITVENIGTGPLTFPAPDSGTNPAISSNFTLNSAAEGACPLLAPGSTASSLAPGDGCQLIVSYVPKSQLLVGGSLAVTDNTLNATNPRYATQTILMTGAGTPAALVTPSPGSRLTSSTATFTWTPATGGTIYGLVLGSTGAGSSNVYNSGHITATSVTVTNLPTDNEPIYATLWTYIPNSGNPWVTSNYTFKAAALGAALTSPVPGSTLTGSTVTFSWAPGTATSVYDFTLGSTGAGSTNLYNSGHIAGTSVTVTGLPTNGEPVYATLWSYIPNSGNPWVINNYTYTAQ